MRLYCIHIFATGFTPHKCIMNIFLGQYICIYLFFLKTAYYVIGLITNTPVCRCIPLQRYSQVISHSSSICSKIAINILYILLIIVGKNISYFFTDVLLISNHLTKSPHQFFQSPQHFLGMQLRQNSYLYFPSLCHLFQNKRFENLFCYSYPFLKNI